MGVNIYSFSKLRERGLRANSSTLITGELSVLYCMYYQGPLVGYYLLYVVVGVHAFMDTGKILQ